MHKHIAIETIKENQPRIARARAAAFLTCPSDVTVCRKRRSLKLSEATRILRFSELKAKFPIATKADLCT